MKKPPANLTVYKASAGSGKTFTLATEYIALLVSNPYQYENILAVTFTNKATEEMKMRIVSQLYGISRRLDDSKPYLSAIKGMTGLPENIIVNNADTALHLLLHNYNRFRVQTIDSFFQMVFRNLARELELTPNLKIEIRDEEIGEKAVDELIERLDEKSQVLRWIRSFISQKIADNKSWNVISLLKSFGKNIFKDYYKEHSDELDSLMADDKFTENYIKALRQIVRSYDENIRQRAHKIIDCFREHGLDDIELFSYKRTGLLAYIYKVASGNFDGSPTSPRIQSFVDDPTKWPAKKCGREDEIIQLAKQRLHTELVELEQARCNGWPLCQSARLVMDNISQLRLLHAIASTVDEINKDKNRFQLSNTQTLLHSLIKDSDSPFVFEKTGANLRHIMIDEFQDTSELQWENFLVLLRNCLAQSDSHNLLVGDVKQSIYRWRGGNWRLLNTIEQQFRPEQIQLCPLTTNYRSARKVVEFNNNFFTIAAKITAAELQDQGISQADELLKAYSEESLVQKVARNDMEGYVSIELLPAEEYEEQMSQRLLAAIDSVMAAGVAAKDITIITRNNRELETAGKLLMSERPDLKVVSSEAFRLDSSLAVGIIVDAMRLLSHPDDMITRARLVKLYQNNVLGHGLTDTELLLADDMNTFLPEGFLGNEQLAAMPLMDLTDALYSLFCLERLDGQNEYVCKFQDVLSEFISSNAPTIGQFLDEWDETLHKKAIQCGSNDGITLLTIHRSKGMEFPVVIMPWCDWQLEKSELIWCGRKEEDPFNRLPIMPITFSRPKMLNTVFEDDYRNEHFQNMVDNMNLLYVGFTRARHTLIVIGKRQKESKTKSRTSAEASGNRSKLIEKVLPQLHDNMEESTLEGADDKTESLLFTLGKPYEASEKAEGNRLTSNVFLAPQRSLDVQVETFATPLHFRQSNRSREFANPEEANDESAVSYVTMGNILHRIFSAIRTLEDIEPQLQQLQLEGVIAENMPDADTLRNKIYSALENPTAQRWFSHEWKLYNECSIILPSNGQSGSAADGSKTVKEYRPDRVMTHDGETVVVDFKFGKPFAGYANQVKGYMNLLRQMGHDKVKGYLWYVLLGEIVEVE